MKLQHRILTTVMFLG